MVFASNTLLSMENIKRFGDLNAAVIFFALLSDFIIAPALLLLISKKKDSERIRTRAIGIESALEN